MLDEINLGFNRRFLNEEKLFARNNSAIDRGERNDAHG